MALLLLVMGSMMTFFSAIQRTTAKQEQRAHGSDELRGAMERVVKDVRQVESVNGGSSASVLNVATYVNGVATTIVYTASGTTLTRRVGATTQTILTDLASTALFTYKPLLAAPTLIGVTISVRPYASDATTTISLTSDVRLRNRS